MRAKRKQAVETGRTILPWADRLAEDRRLERSLVRDFIRAARIGDVKLGGKALRAIDTNVPWRWSAVMRAIAKAHASDEFRRWFLNHWLSHGGHIRQEVGDDLTLADGLRALLPPYTGSALTLFRAETAGSRRFRRYGLSWTASPDIARQMALGTMKRCADGGSVILKAFAPPEAIIYEVGWAEDRYGEEEYVVDRRVLRNVTVIERFPQLSHDEFRKLASRS